MPRPVNYTDPAPGPMGWEWDKLQTRQKLIVEKSAFEASPAACLIGDATPAGAISPAIEKIIRAKFQFDAGWSFHVTDELVYGINLMLRQLVGNCFPAGTRIRMADGTTKPIETLRLRDEVVTAEGRVGMVRQLMTRDVSEVIYEIKAWGHYGIRMTAEHPILTTRGYVEARNIQMDDVVAFPKYAPAERRRVVQTAEYLFEKRRKKDLKPGRRSVNSKGCERVGTKGNAGRTAIEVQQSLPDAVEADANFGRLIGLFLAEGSTEYGKVRFSFAAKEQDTLVKETVELLKIVFGVDATVRPMNRGSVASVVVHNVRLAEILESLCGKTCYTKRLHADLHCTPDECLVAILSGWLAGDGHVRREVIQGTTVSLGLALDMHAIATHLGRQPTITRTYPKPTGTVKTRATRYDVFMPVELSERGSWQVSQDETHVWRRVRSIEQIEFTGPVFNFSVAGDESYVADGIGVHNCVGASHCLLLATRIAHEIVGMGQLEEPLGAGMLGVPFIPFSYGVGRDAAGIRGKGDGSTCQGQIEGTREHGFLPCYIAELKQFKGTGDADFPQGTASANRSFGSSIANCKPWFEYAKKFELKETPLIESADDAYECIAEKKIPIQICSDIGFKHTADKKYGDLYVPGPSWAHSMQLVAALTFKGERFIVVRNQWGDEAHTGNELMGIPGGSMVLAFDVADRYIKRSHAVGIGEIVGLATTLEF